MHNEKDYLFSKIKDKINTYQKTNLISTTNFLEPSQILSVKSLLKEVPYIIFGGVDGAERNIIILGNADIEDCYNYVSILEIESNYNLTHRNILGSILGLGIKREIIGDILINKNKANIFIIPEMQNYLIQNLDKIGKDKIKIRVISKDEIITPEENYSDITTTIASNRVDAIISSSFGISRELSAKLIQGDKVKLNYIELTNTSKKVNIDDLISVRGYGRIILKEILGETRKERIKVILRVYKS